MKFYFYLMSYIIVFLYSCSYKSRKAEVIENSTDEIVKIQMNLNAFGVESDNFSSINAYISFSPDTSVCVKSFYNPENKGSKYSLTKSEMDSIVKLLKIKTIEKLKANYTVNKTDQPSSTIKIYTRNKIFTIDDYGLEGDYPLPELYKIVYKY